MARFRKSARKPAKKFEYWDTTVFLDLLKGKNDERGTTAQALWNDAIQGNRKIYTSEISIAEVVFVADVFVGPLTAQEEQAIEALWNDEKSPVHFVSLNPQIARDARSIKQRCMLHKPKAIPMEIADAIHLACARFAKVSTFFTTDQFRKRPGETQPTLPDQRGNLSKIVGMKVCAPGDISLIKYPNQPKQPAKAAPPATQQPPAPPASTP